MNKTLFLLLFTLFTLSASAQKVYFIYIQTESEQPFFVRVNEKVYSSSTSGYLILSKLYDSTYSFTVGFPQNKWPEVKFSVPVNKKDHGYLLKNFVEKGWGLFDLQTLAIQMPVVSNSKAGTSQGVVNKDASVFTDILSRAADDPTIKERVVTAPIVEVVPKNEPVVQVVTKKEEPVIIKATDPIEPAIVKKDDVKNSIKEEPVITKTVDPAEPATVKKADVKNTIIEEPIPVKTSEKAEPVIAKKEDVIKEIKEEPVIPLQQAVVEEEYNISTVKRRSESSTTEGFGLVFVDNYQNGNSDTIKIIIPNPKVVIPVTKEEPKEEKRLLDIQVEIPTAEEKKNPTELQSVGSPKVSCVETAADADFFKLRKSMAAVDSDDDMIGEAKKYFKQKCFTTFQVKNLSSLFLTDEGKYKFFDASYNHTSDVVNFSSLQAELKEEYFITRFKAMLRN